MNGPSGTGYLARILRPLLTLALLAAIMGGCGSGRRGAPFGEPIRFSGGRLLQGQIIFMRECSHCHPGGAGGLGPSLNEKPLPALGMRIQVRRGFGAMPAFSEEELDDDSLEAVIAYLNALQAGKDPQGPGTRGSGSR